MNREEPTPSERRSLKKGVIGRPGSGLAGGLVLAALLGVGALAVIRDSSCPLAAERTDAAAPSAVSPRPPGSPATALPTPGATMTHSPRPPLASRSAAQAKAAKD
ncbi:MAG TPA: hypothetical protein VLJ16_09580, partial [Acidobacteriota bacterium]|nr:hypothetical protein [Acidobacteriota bacterium]